VFVFPKAQSDKIMQGAARALGGPVPQRHIHRAPRGHRQPFQSGQILHAARYIGEGKTFRLEIPRVKSHHPLHRLAIQGRRRRLAQGTKHIGVGQFHNHGAPC